MKNPARKLFLIAAILVMAGILNTPLAAQESARVSVILVEASNGPGGVDGSLKQYAATLQRMFRFSSYKQASRSGMNVRIPGEASTGLPGGQQLTLKAMEGGGDRLVALGPIPAGVLVGPAAL